MKMTANKRFAVRTALVTSTTLATIIGAQALASLDAATFETPAQPAAAPANTIAQPTGVAVIAQPSAALAYDNMITDPSQPVGAAAPNIVILRHAGAAPAISIQTQTPAQSSPSSVQASASPLQPPSPVQVVPPAPVVQQVTAFAPQVAAAPAPSAPTTRSSR